MEENNKSKKEKLTYDEMTNIATQLSKQNEQLYNQLQQANLSNTFARLEFLFKVVENKNKFSEDFFTKCVNEIEQIMTIPQTNNNPDE